MSIKINNSFLEIYKEIDKACCAKFGVAKFGVTEYINRLVNSRFAQNREETLSHLIKYRKIRNVLVQNETAFISSKELGKNDIKWLENFLKSVKAKRDPISAYLKRARGYVAKRRFFIGLAVVLGVAVAVLAVLFATGIL